MNGTKFFAIIIAGCFVFSSTLTANAEDVFQDFLSMGYTTGYVEYPSGAVQHQSCLTHRSILIETDDTVLTKEDVQNLHGFSSFRTITWSEAEELDYADLSFEEGKKLYLVNFDDLEQLRETARQFQLQNHFIRNVYLIRSESVSPVYRPWRFEIKPIEDDTVLNLRDFPQFSSLQKEHYEDNGYWYASMSDALREESDALYEKNSYDEYLFAVKIAEEVLTEHSDILSSVEADCSSMNAIYSEILKTQSVWDGAGDCNADGTVNAQDAAEQLIAAANAGTGGEVEITSANDINADGEVNALDAAAVLAYAAAQGSGENVSWVEILG